MDCARDGEQRIFAGVPCVDAAHVFTPLAEAVAEVQRRRTQTDLLRRVEDFLHGDIPDYLRGPEPALYLARHIATPNFETLRFLELARPFGLPTLLAQDSHDKFVTRNAMKRAYGKLPVQRKGDLLEYVTLIDFTRAEGARLCDIRTRVGVPLLEFHNNLLHHVPLRGAQVVDDASWTDRQQRGDLPEHYKRFLALCVAHGVMLEDYLDEEALLVRNVLKPAFAFVERHFGVVPLISTLCDADVMPTQNWYAYPHAFHAAIRQAAHGK